MFARKAISSNIYFRLIFLLFSILDWMKLICIFFGNTLQFCYFESIFNTMLTIIISYKKQWIESPVVPFAKRKWSVISRFRYSMSNLRIFKCTYAIFYLLSFTSTIILAGHMIFSKSLTLLFRNEKMMKDFNLFLWK